MKTKVFPIFIFSLMINASTEISIDLNKQDLINNFKQDTSLIEYSNYGSKEYWSENNKRDFVVKSLVKCLSTSCAHFSAKDMSDIYIEARKEFGEREGKKYFNNVVAALLIGSPHIKRNEVYASAKQHMDFEQKIYLAHTLGSLMLNQYDYSRDEEGIVSEEDIFNSLKNNTRAGVCRDIAIVQAKVLKELGVKQVYVVAYKTQEYGHATVVAKDPNNSNRVINFNYGETRTNEGSGANLLSQDTTLADFGSTYRIFKPDGTAIDRIPTEVGYILNQVSGMDTDLVSSGTDYSGMSLVTIDHKTSIGLNAKGFYANDNLGSETKGISIYTNDVRSQYIDSGLGGAIYSNEKILNGREFEKKSTGIFLGVETRLKSPKLNFGPVRNFYADLKTNLSIVIGEAYQKSGSFESEGSFSDTNNMLSSSLYAETNILGFNWKSVVTSHASIMKLDVRDETKHTVALLGGTIENVLRKEISDKFGVKIKNKVYIKSNGATAEYSLVIRSLDNKYEFEVGLEKPLYGDPAFWLKGAEQKAYIGAKTKIMKENLELGIRYIKKKGYEEIYEMKGKYKF